MNFVSHCEFCGLEISVIQNEKILLNVTDDKNNVKICPKCGQSPPNEHIIQKYCGYCGFKLS